MSPPTCGRKREETRPNVVLVQRHFLVCRIAGDLPERTSVQPKVIEVAVAQRAQFVQGTAVHPVVGETRCGAFQQVAHLRQKAFNRAVAFYCLIVCHFYLLSLHTFVAPHT